MDDLDAELMMNSFAELVTSLAEQMVREGNLAGPTGRIFGLHEEEAKAALLAAVVLIVGMQRQRAEDRP